MSSVTKASLPSLASYNKDNETLLDVTKNTALKVDRQNQFKINNSDEFTSINLRESGLAFNPKPVDLKKTLDQRHYRLKAGLCFLITPCTACISMPFAIYYLIKSNR